jgi:hypothetical protein
VTVFYQIRFKIFIWVYNITLWLRRFVHNRNSVCGIIPDVMTLSAEWRHFHPILTLLTVYLFWRRFYMCNICIWLQIVHVPSAVKGLNKLLSWLTITIYYPHFSVISNEMLLVNIQDHRQSIYELIITIWIVVFTIQIILHMQSVKKCC